MTAAVPPGWPAGMHPPGTPEFEKQAVNWLLDLCPPDYRAYDVLRRFPLILARFAAGHLLAAIGAARAGIAGARADLSGLVPPAAIDAALAAYERELVRLTAASRAVDVVAQALRGTQFRHKL